MAYTEAEEYFPYEGDYECIVNWWRKGEYQKAEQYLQSAGLRSVNISPDFAGRFHPGRPTCLFVFPGYEPNRTVGLVDEYAPSRVIVAYGESPQSRFAWRTGLSRTLHEGLFDRWYLREVSVSTLDARSVGSVLENEYVHLQDKYEFAVAPMCSKMQAVASFEFWQDHPEVQLVFTTPVRFNPERYSKGAGTTYVYGLAPR